MAQLPLIAALFLNGPGPEAAEPSWFTLTEVERFVSASSSLRSETDQDIGSGMSMPDDGAQGTFWAGGARGDAALGADASALADSAQLSGPANSGAFWSMGDIDLVIDAGIPLLDADSEGASVMSFVLHVLRPTRLECFVQLVTEGQGSAFTWSSLRAGVEGDGPVVYSASIDTGQLLIEEPRTLPAGEYLLEAGAFCEISDPEGLATGKSGFLVSLTPSSDSCNAADIVEPFGQLDFNDIQAFLAAFAARSTDADLGRPVGLYDISDVVAFLEQFSAGCP